MATQRQYEDELLLNLRSNGYELTRNDVTELLQIQADLITSILQQEMRDKKNEKNPTIVLRGLGRLTVRSYPARKGRNPQTGETIRIKASKKIRMTVAKPVKDKLKVK